MKWKNREKELKLLRAKYKNPNSGNTIPSYKVERKYPSLSDGFAKIEASKPVYEPPPHLIVDILHKQGPMVISKDELKYSGGKKV
jgi:hypothetical protein